jgi:dipeptidyl aminopeptidase/acylaminoacyl peptidase
MQAPSDGRTAPELLLSPEVGNWLNDWSRDGEFIIYALDSRTTSGDLWILPITGDRKPRPYLQTPAYEGGGTFSPDGQWVAYTSTVSGRSEVYVDSFPQAASPRQISTSGGSNPIWRKDGREVLFVAHDQTLMSAEFPKQGLPDNPVLKKLFRLPVPLAAAGRWHQFAVTGDGSRFLAIVPEPRTTPKSITVVVNWLALDRLK